MSAPPREESARLEGLDLARFVALVGMVIVNFNVVMVTDSGTGGISSKVAEMLQGRAAATFVVLAGIGLGLGTARYEWTQTLVVTLKRAAFLLVVGLLNMLIFDADIIHYYALYFLFGVMFVRAPVWVFCLAMFLLTSGFVALAVWADFDAGWNWTTYAYSDFWTARGFVRNLFFNGWHPVVPWLAFFLLGLLLTRAALRERRTQHRLVLAGVGVFAATMLMSHWIVEAISSSDAEAAILFSTSPVPPMPLYMLAGSGAACAVIGLCLLLERPLRNLYLLTACAATGRQTLTLYIAHIVLGMGTLEALGMLGGQTARTAMLAAGLFCVGAMAFALAWSRFFKRGPFESLMRRLAA